MTEAAALLKFFSGFDIPAYPSTSVPDNAEFPYLTFDNTVSFFEDGDVDIAANLWYKTESEAIPSAKAREIAKAIGDNGVTLPFDSGRIWVQRGRPWCQNLSDPDDNSIKRRYLIVSLTYLNGGI